MEISQKKILIINGSIRGMNGNSGQLVETTKSILEQQSVVTTTLTLTDPMLSIEAVHDLMLQHDGFVVVSGIYWNNWGSPLQRFIEVATVFENTPAFFGKPVCCAVSMDSVGGIEVAGRIHSVFSGFGCWSPPCSTFVISRVGQEALAASEGSVTTDNDDVWRLDDLEIVLKNLVASLIVKGDWVSWSNVNLKISGDAWPSSGELNMGSPVFI